MMIFTLFPKKQENMQVSYVLVLSNKFVGCIHQCECGAVLAYTPADINENCFIYCPICHMRQKTTMDLSYDGVIKEEKNEEK